MTFWGVSKFKDFKYYKLLVVFYSVFFIPFFVFTSVDSMNKAKENIELRKNCVNVNNTTRNIKKNNFSKKEAFKKLNNVINNLTKEKNVNYKEVIDNIKKNKDSEEFMSKKFSDFIYLSDIMNNKDIKNSTAITLLSFAQMIKDTKSKPNLEFIDKMVYLDEKTKIAYIPVDLFTSSPSAMSFELNYINGEWRLNPYTLLQSITLSSILQNH